MTRVLFILLAINVLQTISAIGINANGTSTAVACPSTYPTDAEIDTYTSKIDVFQETGWTYNNIYSVAVCYEQAGVYHFCAHSLQSKVTLEISLAGDVILSPLTALFKTYDNLYCHIFSARQIAEHVGQRSIEGATIRASVTMFGTPHESTPTFHAFMRAASHIVTQDALQLPVPAGGFFGMLSTICPFSACKVATSRTPGGIQEQTFDFSTKPGQAPQYVEDVPWTNGMFSVTDYICPITCELDFNCARLCWGDQPCRNFCRSLLCKLTCFDQFNVTIPTAGSYTKCPVFPAQDNCTCPDQDNSSASPGDKEISASGDKENSGKENSGEENSGKENSGKENLGQENSATSPGNEENSVTSPSDEGCPTVSPSGQGSSAFYGSSISCILNVVVLALIVVG